MNRFRTIIIPFILIIVLGGCGTAKNNNDTTSVSSNQTDESTTLNELSESEVLTTSKESTTTLVESDKSEDYDKLFAPIISAYATLEQSGYTLFDEDIIKDSLLAKSSGIAYNFGWEKPNDITFAFYDINDDGINELLIGADQSICGIYALQNGKAESVIQVEDRYLLSLYTDHDDNCVIGNIWGRMGYAREYFYTIDENGILITLDQLYTEGDIKNGDELIGSIREKDIDGEKVSITEEEYCALIRKYGSWGYQPFENVGEARMINFEWKPVSTYGNSEAK